MTKVSIHTRHLFRVNPFACNKLIEMKFFASMREPVATDRITTNFLNLQIKLII